jgi:hypothetical protein
MSFYIGLGRIKLFRGKRIPWDYSISAHRLPPRIQKKWEMLRVSWSVPLGMDWEGSWSVWSRSAYSKMKCDIPDNLKLDVSVLNVERLKRRRKFAILYDAQRCRGFGSDTVLSIFVNKIGFKLERHFVCVHTLTCWPVQKQHLIQCHQGPTHEPSPQFQDTYEISYIQCVRKVAVQL